MARVYPNCYTQSAMHNMGYYFMYGVEGCHLDPDKLASMVVTSGLARSLSLGLPLCTTGMTGRGLICRTFRMLGMDTGTIPHINAFYFPVSYWAGYVAAYYQ